MEEALALFKSAVSGEKSGEIDGTPRLVRRERHGLAELLLRARRISPLLGQSVLRVMSFGGVQPGNFLRKEPGLVRPTPEKAGGLEAVLEKIVQCFEVARIDLDRFFKILAGFGRVAWSSKRRGMLGAPPKGAAEPKITIRIRPGGDALLESPPRLLVIAHHVVVASD